jgi:hypothetical protein
MTHSSSKSARCRPGSTREQEHLSHSAGTSGRNGQANLRPEKRVIYPRASSTLSSTMSGQGRHWLLVGSARTWLQRQYFSARCRSHLPPRAAYLGRAQESPGGCRCLTGQKLRLPKAGVPLGTSRRDFPIHAGSLGPHRVHAQHSACGPGSPRQRTPSLQPSNPPRREGAPRLPPQAWGTLQQRGGSESLARTTRSAGFQPSHTTGAVPARFRTPTTITKYSGETRPELWLADYRLACQLGGTDDDNLVIRNLPLFLSDSARAWLEHLPPGQISNWDDLVQAFAGNFQGMYVRPGNSWDLRSCRQQPGESLRDYIR